MRLTANLDGLSRCPHCGVANPLLLRLWDSGGFVPRHTAGQTSRWGAYGCTSCGNVVAAKGMPGANAENTEVIDTFPKPKEAHTDIPAIPRKYLQQAYETLHAPDAAAVMAGSAVDAMLKELQYVEGSLYDRIDAAVKDHILTKGMGRWAHSVRLGSNRPRHADKDKPHLSQEETKNSVYFAEALANFLFVLRARVERGIEEAKGAAEG